MKTSLIIAILIFGAIPAESSEILTADLVDADTLIVVFDGDASIPDLSDYLISPEIPIKEIIVRGDTAILCFSSPASLKQNYSLTVKNEGSKNFRLTGVLDKIYSDAPLGCWVEGGKTHFALFAPRALKVEVEIFEFYQMKKWIMTLEMTEGKNGVWTAVVDSLLLDRSYGYRISGPEGDDEQFDPDILIADPYSKLVMTKNDHTHEALSYIITQDLRREDDTWLDIDYQDLIIYEMHVRDMTAHESSGLKENGSGSYYALCQSGYKGGLDYIKSMGVNAIELLPVQEFGNIEIPYGVETNGVTNTWNYYSRNHWGYMTSYFFAPENSYVSGADLVSGTHCGANPYGEISFTNLVRDMHKEGIAVIMDVVYNHVSQYDYNPLKFVDKKYYFRLDADNNYLGHSGCGNDLNTNRPMTRRLIIDSLKRWMVDFHVDGFRFDLATMIDWETLDAIKRELTAINPHVILIAEPWGGGGYDPGGMSEHGYAAWNDVFRNTIKGQNPHDGLGLIFGEYWGGADFDKIKSLILGYETVEGGFFQDAAHSVNYLESHDDHTLGDFIRLGLRNVSEEDSIVDLEKHTKLDKEELAISKLAALILMTSRGPVMIAEGQEFARSKVIANTDAPDPRIGRIDHNSYEKDNETNWLNYDLADLNRELSDYYRDLINCRKDFPLITHAARDDYTFFRGSGEKSFGFIIESDTLEIAVLINPDESSAEFDLPGNRWKVQTGHDCVNAMKSSESSMNFGVLPISGVILLKR